MRLRVLVSAAGTPAAVSSEPFDVLENGDAGARWTVADAHETDVPLNDARSGLLRTLQARVGLPARPPQPVLVRLPRRLSGPRLHGGPLSMSVWQCVQLQREERGNARGWAEAIRWLRGRLPLPPAGPPSSERMARAADLVNVDLVPACWELSYPVAGLGLPKPLPHRLRRPCPACAEMDGWGCQEHQRGQLGWTGPLRDDLLPGPPLNSEAVAREVGRVVSAAGARASDVRVEGGRVHFTATIERALDEAPELPRLGPNDPNPHGVDPEPALMPIADVELTVLPPPHPPRATLAALRRAAAELAAQRAQTNADGTYNAYLGPAAMHELRSDPEFQRMAMGLLYDNREADGSTMSISGLRLFERRGTGWSVEPGGARVDFRIDLSQAAPSVSFGPGLRQTAPIAEFRVISRPDRGLRLTLQASARSTAVFVDALVAALRDQPRALAMVDVLGSRLALRSFQQHLDDRRAALHIDLDLVEPPRWAS